MKVLWLILLFFVSVVSAAQGDSVIKVKVQKNESGAWQINYQLPYAVHQVYFYRLGSLPRDKWRLKGSHLKWSKGKDNQDIIESVDGTLFDQLSVGFDSDFRTTPKDYELNFAFSDGGLLLYTGHLLLATEADKKMAHEFTFMPQKNSHIIIDGQMSQHEYRWNDKNWQGTYVYFGALKPIQSDGMMGVIDGGLPDWVKQKLTSSLPKLFEFYTQKTGLALDFTPVIYFSFSSSESPGTQYSGGTLPGLIQLNLTGDDWNQESPENLQGLLHFLAHEAAHLWNSQLIKSDEERESSWIHEGGADAFAVRSLVYLGVWDEEDAAKAHEQYLNGCLDLLNGHQVTHFAGHHNFSVYYQCGATIAWLTELAVQQKNDQLDLFDFWRDLMSRVKQSDLVLTPSQYIKSLLLLTDNQSNVANLITLLSEPQERPNAFMQQAFSAVGLTVKGQKKHPMQAKKAAELAFKHLMMIDCGGYSYHKSKHSFTVGANLSCQHLKSGMEVTHIMDLAIGSEGHVLFDQVSMRCQQGQTVAVKTKNNETIELLCQQPPAEVRPWLTVVKRKN